MPVRLDRPEKSLVKPTESSPSERGGLPRGSVCVSDAEWEGVEERLMLYLRLLKVPALKALELALNALKSSQRELDEGGEGYPLTLTMRHLWRLLEVERTGEGSSLLGREGVPGDALSMPPLNRGSMRPEGL